MTGFWELILAALIALVGGATATEEADRTDLVALVGDSITWEHSDILMQELNQCGSPPVMIDALPGRVTTTSDTLFGYIPSGVDAIREIEQTADPDTWIIELGVNDVNSGRVPTRAWAQFVIDSVFDLIDEDDTVYWVNTYTEVGRPADSALFNSVLEADDRIADVLDWASNASPYLYDGLHPTSEGARFMASMYCDILN